MVWRGARKKLEKAFALKVLKIAMRKRGKKVKVSDCIESEAKPSYALHQIDQSTCF